MIHYPKLIQIILNLTEIEALPKYIRNKSSEIQNLFSAEIPALIRTISIYKNLGCNTTPTWGQMNCYRAKSLGHSSREKYIWVVTGPQLGVRSSISGPH